MKEKIKILSPKLDLIFKLLFGTENSVEILTDFLLAVLNLSPSEYVDITISNPFLLQDYKGGKLGILDVKLKLKTGKVLNIEIQIDPMPFMESRIVFYVSKLITEQIGESDQYDKIKRVISIIITDHALIKGSEAFHHQFGLYDIKNKVLLTDILEIHTLEIPKARKLFDGVNTDNAQLLDWMKFLDAKTEEELNVLAQKNPVIQKAALRLLELSADEQARQLYEARLKEQLDINTREYWATKQTALNIAKNLLNRGMSIEDVSIDTGLSHEEVEAIYETL
ncbi:MAG: Rpn family recombination-promoting nuclease/putative transposase [Defluviitaleaceae bacterium]|nr:Rpn family recombination-promoting nuclease/putative transposase [Defluviitaleaceae bacterium]